VRRFMTRVIRLGGCICHVRSGRFGRDVGLRCAVSSVEVKGALTAPLLVVVTVAASGCAGTQVRGEPGPSGPPHAAPLAAPVSLSIRSVRTLKAHLEVRRLGARPAAIRLGDSRLRFLLATSSCRPVGVSAHALGRTLRLRLRPNHDFCEQVLRAVDVLVTLSRPVLHTDAITRVAVTYAPLHLACREAGTCRRPRARLLRLVRPRI
jgi:hypothetical protein